MLLIAIIAILVAMMPFATAVGKNKARRIQCVNNLRSMGLGIRLWSGDHGGSFPFAVSVTNGGAMELAASGGVIPAFQVLSNELATPRILLCPADTKRESAKNFGDLRATNSSYFINLDANDAENPHLWLSGDRNITNRFQPVRSVLLVLTNSPVGWNQTLHSSQGNVALTDGSAQQFTSARLQRSLLEQTNVSFRLVLPE